MSKSNKQSKSSDLNKQYTKEEFERIILLDSLPLEEYEDYPGYITSDIYMFYDFRIMVSILLDKLKEELSRRILFKSGLKDDIAAIERDLAKMYDPDIQYRIFSDNRQDIEDFNLLSNYLDSTYTRTYVDGLRRLRAYSDSYSGLEPKEVLKKWPIEEYGAKMLYEDPEKFEVWAKQNPGYDVNELKRIRAKQLKEIEEYKRTH